MDMSTNEPAPGSPPLEQLRTFCAAADLGSIGRAAQRLHLSQPAVSKRLKALEEGLGVALLERSPRGVRMTPAGERLYPHARRLLSDMEELSAVVGQLKGARRTVRLAISHTAAEFMMPRALVLMRRHTSAAVEVFIANSRVVKEMVLADQAEVGVAACLKGESIAGVVNVALQEDEIVLAVPLGHPWARRREVASKELASTPIVLRDPGAHTRQTVDEALQAHRLGALTAACEVGSTQAAKDEAHELGLPTLMSRLALTPADGLEAVRVEGLRFERSFCAFHQRGSLSEAGAHLIDGFREGAVDGT